MPAHHGKCPATFASHLAVLTGPLWRSGRRRFTANLMRKKKTTAGFTLMEILIVVAIVGVLASIALPSYSRFILKSGRSDAKDALTAVQFAQEKWRANNSSYTASLADLGLTATTQQRRYTVSVSTTASGYLALATASGAQSADAACPHFLVTERGIVSDATYTAGGVSVDTASSAYKACWGLS